MIVTKSIFYFLSSIAIIASCCVITSKNPVKAVLFLVVTFLAMAGNWMILGAEFLSVILIIVYVGAVMVLFLFVVMMLDLEKQQLKNSLVKFYPIGFIVAGILITLIVLNLYGAKDEVLNLEGIKIAADYNNVKELGVRLYTDFVFPFEIAGVILLVAMIAAIGLAFRGKRSKSQAVFSQTFVTKKERLRIVDAPSVKREEL